MNVICERTDPECMQRMVSVLEKVLTSVSMEYQHQIEMISGDSKDNLRFELCKILFDQYANHFITCSQCEPLDLFVFVYLGIVVEKFTQVLEGITTFLFSMINASSPSLDYSVKSEENICRLMHSITEISLLLSMFYYGLYASIVSGEGDVKSFTACDILLRFLSEHKAIMLLCAYSVRYAHMTLAFALERYE